MSANVQQDIPVPKWMTSISRAVEATAALTPQSTVDEIQLVVGGQEGNLKGALLHMGIPDCVPDTYKGAVVITLDVLSFQLFVKCGQPFYHLNGTAFAPFFVDDMVPLDSDETKTIAGALNQLHDHLCVAWHGLKDNNGLQKEDYGLYTQIESMVSRFETLWTRFINPRQTGSGSSDGGSGKSGTHGTHPTSVSGSEDGVSEPPSAISLSEEQGPTVGGPTVGGSTV
jgi:hypothetical protein